MTLDELIAKLEAATCGSWELTADVYEFLGYDVKRSLLGREPFSGRVWAYLKDSRWLAMEALTTSVDAALRLISEDRFVDHLGQMPSGWDAQLSDKIDDRLYWEAVGATTPALALCIAALKAWQP